MRVKACGITRLEDARAAVDLGYDAVGFVFYRESKRFIEPEKAAAIVAELPPFISTVALFVDESEKRAKEILLKTRIEVAQFHGRETPDYVNKFPLKVIKAFGVDDHFDFSRLGEYQASAFLLDTFSREMPGGTGKSFDWSLVKRAKSFGPVILAGGLNPGNVGAAVGEADPFAVDVSTGIEAVPGQKSRQKMMAFIKAVRSAMPRV